MRVDVIMLIINADDFGISQLATERIIECYIQRRITSTSAMVFMVDSQRAAELQKDNRIDVGLHLNFTQELTGCIKNDLFRDYHNHIATFLSSGKYNFMIYNPNLRKAFKYVFQIQLEEFERLYEMPPSHINGHHHMHLCTNMLVDKIIPSGQKVRRNFSFSKGEKSLLNRLYRSGIDKWLMRRFLTTDYFFSLQELIKNNRLKKAVALAESSIVELETHPEIDEEFNWFMNDTSYRLISNIQKGAYQQLNYAFAKINNSERING